MPHGRSFTAKRDALMNDVTRRGVLLSGAALVIAALPETAEAATGSVFLKVVSGGFIVGFGGGSGVLTFRRERYPLKVGGISLGATIGVSGVEMVGTAYHLHDPRDIEGDYSATSAGVAVAGGGAVAELSNARGVVLRLRGRQVGFKLSVALSGLSISLA
jgi:hypothetical protein